MKLLFIITIFAFYSLVFLTISYGQPGNDHLIQDNGRNSKDDAEVIILDDAMSTARKRSEFGKQSDLSSAQETPILVDVNQPISERLSSIETKKGAAVISKSNPKLAEQNVQTKTKNAPKAKKIAQQTASTTTPTTTTIKQSVAATSTAPSTEKERTTNTTQTSPPQQTSKASSQTVGQTTPTTTTTTTPIPTTTSETKPIPEDLYCLCDIHSHACDMNCCCDTDCRDEDRTFFSHCSDQVGIHDERSSPRRQRSCYKSFVTFKHYTAESGVVNDNGMLCVLRDNSKVDNVLPTSKLDEIRKRISAGEIDIQPKYSINNSRKVSYKQEPYKFGSPIVGVKVLELLNDKVDLVPYGLPSAFHSIPCNEIKEPVKFLQDFNSRCQISITNLTKECRSIGNFDANSFINHMQILTNPGKWGGENPDRELVSITPRKICNAELCSTEWEDPNDNNEFPRPVYNEAKQLCQNVLSGLNITFYFGLEGITDIVASAQLQDLPIIPTKQLTQEFRSRFQWNTEINSTDARDETTNWPRSGNPGYIVGKPVIMGKKVIVLKETLKGNGNQVATTQNPEEAEEKESKEVEMVKVSKDHSGWMTIHGPGKCPENPQLSPRKSVQFDYSHMSLCSLNLTEFRYCEDLQLFVAKVLLGVSDPLNFEKRMWQVAAFGNSNPKEPSAWVPVTTKNFPLGIIPTAGNSKGLISKGCDSIVSTLHITITYAFVGSTDFPQAKITGVLYEPGESTSFLPRDLSKGFGVSTTVSFKDVTAPAIMRIARWPVLSITLPKDFFYPFSR